MTRIKIVGFVVLVVSISFAIRQSLPHVDDLPPLAEVVSIEARLIPKTPTKGADFDSQSFPVPRALWTTLYDSLQPRLRDENVPGWQGLAILQIKTTERRSIEVLVFDTGQNAGAFAIKVDENRQVNYRGGKPGQLRPVLLEANAAFTQSAP